MKKNNEGNSRNTESSEQLLPTNSLPLAIVIAGKAGVRHAGRPLPAGKELEDYVYSVIGSDIWPFLWHHERAALVRSFAQCARSGEIGWRQDLPTRVLTVAKWIAIEAGTHHTQKVLPKGKRLEKYVDMLVGPEISRSLWQSNYKTLVALFAWAARPGLDKGWYLKRNFSVRPKEGSSRQAKPDKLPRITVSGATIAEYRRTLARPPADQRRLQNKPEDARTAIYKRVKLPRQNYDDST